jgi:hypothetical protein
MNLIHVIYFMNLYQASKRSYPASKQIYQASKQYYQIKYETRSEECHENEHRPDSK